jgi:hypothetical protein
MGPLYLHWQGEAVGWPDRFATHSCTSPRPLSLAVASNRFCSLQKGDMHPYMGRWVFRGYIHHGNFVGRWRESSTAVDMIGYEGGFVLCKTADF